MTKNDGGPAMKKDKVIKISMITSDQRYGDWYAFATKKEWAEIRVTPKGYLRLYDIHKGEHPYFTP